jgi:cytoskeleton-associated protein 2
MFILLNKSYETLLREFKYLNSAFCRKNCHCWSHGGAWVLCCHCGGKVAQKAPGVLAVKGKLKNQNSKPYLKAKNNCLNPPPSNSSIRPKKGVTSDAILPVKTTRPVNIKLQPRSANITGSQKPKLEPPKLLNKKRLTSRYVSANPNCNLSSKSHQQHEGGSSTTGKLSRKSMRSFTTQESKTKKQQETDQGNAKRADFVDKTQVENSSLDGFLKDTNKENLPQTLSEPKQKTDSELCNISKPRTDS